MTLKITFVNYQDPPPPPPNPPPPKEPPDDPPPPENPPPDDPCDAGTELMVAFMALIFRESERFMRYGLKVVRDVD